MFKNLFLLILFVFTMACVQEHDANKAVSGGAAATIANIQGISNGGKLGLSLQMEQYYWLRGCESRATNLAADAFAWKTGVQIAFVNAGSVRHDRDVKFLAKNVTPTLKDIKGFIPFGQRNTFSMNGFRIKQAIEGGLAILENTKVNSANDDQDVDGDQHGNCYKTPPDESTGSGRFLIPSSRLRVTVNPANSPQTVTGIGFDGNLRVLNEGNRVTKLTFDSIVIYDNPSGSFTSGWGNGNSSCTVKGNSYSQSAACTMYSVTIGWFYSILGGDNNPSFNPQFPEINNDGSVTITGEQTYFDSEAVFEYMQQTLIIYPRVDGRISLP